MPETSSSTEAAHDPATVGSTFMRQYYHLLAKAPDSLHRFYKDESIWCHGVGSHMQAPIAGQKAIHDEILRRGYAGARVDLDIGSIDCQASLHGGVFVLVTGVMTLTSSPVPKPFVQTFFLAVQPKGYFVLNDCLRFLELSAPSAADAAVAPTDAKKQPTHAAIGTPVAAASPVQTKPATPVAKPATPVAKPTPTSPVAKPVTPAPASPVKKVASPVKVASPKAAPASPVKKTETKAAPKPSETKPATPASPAAAPEKAAAKAASPAQAKPAAPAVPVVPAAPPAPKTWAALFSSAPAAAPATPSAAPKAKPTPKPASPATKPADAAAPAAAAAATPAAPQEKEKKRYFSIYIRDLPEKVKEADLRELFKSYGEIANVTVPPGRGFAFVDYFQEESMRAVLADTKEFKLFDKVIHVDERTDRKDKDRSGPRSETRGGRGAPKSGRTGERKEREDGKERRPADKDNANGKAPASSNGPRSNSERREKGGRRSGKEGGARNE